MSQLLQIGGFNWFDPSQFTPDGISRLASGNKGYMLKVDVRYLRDLHDPHDDLPFMCEKMKINGGEKLVPNHNKKKYVIIIRRNM